MNFAINSEVNSWTVDFKIAQFFFRKTEFEYTLSTQIFEIYMFIIKTKPNSVFVRENGVNFFVYYREIGMFWNEFWNPFWKTIFCCRYILLAV